MALWNFMIGVHQEKLNYLVRLSAEKEITNTLGFSNIIL